MRAARPSYVESCDQIIIPMILAERVAQGFAYELVRGGEGGTIFVPDGFVFAESGLDDLAMAEVVGQFNCLGFELGREGQEEVEELKS